MITRRRFTQYLITSSVSNRIFLSLSPSFFFFLLLSSLLLPPLPSRGGAPSGQFSGWLAGSCSNLLDLPGLRVLSCWLWLSSAGLARKLCFPWLCLFVTDDAARRAAGALMIHDSANSILLF